MVKSQILKGKSVQTSIQLIVNLDYQVDKAQNKSNLLNYSLTKWISCKNIHKLLLEETEWLPNYKNKMMIIRVSKMYVYKFISVTISNR